MRPHEILPPSTTECETGETTTENANDDAASGSSSSSSPRTPLQRSPHRALRDPAISASDLEGRRRLLLEPCAMDDVNSLGGELAGFRPRSSNAGGVQLLLIHYNGWPHRWDEWIRSDSERLRPFRTRTRHPAMVSPVQSQSIAVCVGFVYRNYATWTGWNRIILILTSCLFFLPLIYFPSSHRQHRPLPSRSFMRRRGPTLFRTGPTMPMIGWHSCQNWHGPWLPSIKFYSNKSRGLQECP